MSLCSYTEKSIPLAVEVKETLNNVMRYVQYCYESVFMKSLDLIQDY